MVRFSVSVAQTKADRPSKCIKCVDSYGTGASNKTLDRYTVIIPRHAIERGKHPEFAHVARVSLI